MTKTKVCVIEDVPEMLNLICMYLNNADYESMPFETAEDALAALRKGALPALVLLDLALPAMSGYEFLKIFRREFKPTIPVVIVSARDADEDIIKALEYGADEFVTKPFSPRVLVATLTSRLSRLSETERAVEETFSFGPYTVFFNSCILRRGSSRIPLSTKEYEVLEYLIRNAGHSVTPEQIFTSVWALPFGDTTAIGVYIQRLRRKIEEDPSNPRYIITDFGKGYRFVPRPDRTLHQ